MLEITAETDDGTIMGAAPPRAADVEGVQFHPESILTVGGHDLLANFLDAAPAEQEPGFLRPAGGRGAAGGRRGGVGGGPGLPMRMVTVDPGAAGSAAPGVWSITTLA